MELHGYTGKILEIDLKDERISVKQEKEEDLRKFIGGFGMNCKLAAEYLKPRIDPFSPENVIILGTGPLVGTIMPGSSRLVGITKFPATGAIANSCGSMSFGFHLKQSGYDHVVIKEISDKPIYIYINNDDVRILDASNLWGKDIAVTTDYMWKHYGSCSIIAIGRAGENKINGALALIDKTSTFGRGGLAAVMGHKKVKCIVVKGNKGIKIAQQAKFLKKYKSFIERVKNYPHRPSWIELGMLRSLPVGMILSAKGEKKKARQCNEKSYLKKMKKRRIACPSCPMADKDILEIKEGDFAGLICYASSVINPFLMFTIDGLSTYNEAIKIFDEINRNGLDGLTITSLFDFIGRMHSKGLITDSDLGFEWKNDFETLKSLLKIILNKEGFGKVLAKGWNAIVALKEEFADEIPAIKGLDVVFDPRLIRLGTMEFEQVVNPKGAHIASGGSPTYVGAGGTPDKMRRHFDRMGIPKDAQERIFKPPREAMGINVGRLTRYAEDWYAVLTSLGLCARAQMNRFYSLNSVTEFYSLITGFDLTAEELRKAAERSWNLLRLLNYKEGFKRENDSFPNIWFKTLKYGPNELKIYDYYGTTLITPDIAKQLIDDYYDERGWDIKSGTPKKEKLISLELKEYI
ncbi:MAG: aldehyde ferredoxin oxidoreductase N-terminal domain-containing protein [Promethearchaeota archaeon]